MTTNSTPGRLGALGRSSQLPTPGTTPTVQPRLGAGRGTRTRSSALAIGARSGLLEGNDDEDDDDISEPVLPPHKGRGQKPRSWSAAKVAIDKWKETKNPNDLETANLLISHYNDEQAKKNAKGKSSATSQTRGQQTQRGMKRARIEPTSSDDDYVDSPGSDNDSGSGGDSDNDRTVAKKGGRGAGTTLKLNYSSTADQKVVKAFFAGEGYPTGAGVTDGKLAVLASGAMVGQQHRNGDTYEREVAYRIHDDPRVIMATQIDHASLSVEILKTEIKIMEMAREGYAPQDIERLRRRLESAQALTSAIDPSSLTPKTA